MRHPSRLLPWLCVLSLSVSVAAAAPQAPPSAAELVDRALAAMGGADALRQLRALQISGVGDTNMLEQSERPEGPYIVAYTQFEQLRDLQRQRLQTTERTRSIVAPDGFETNTWVGDGIAVVRFGERSFPGSAEAVSEARDALAFGPERVLLHARQASDLRRDGQASIQGFEHQVVAFTYEDVPVRVLLNPHTALPTAVEWTRDYGSSFWGIWGDVTTRIEYSLWHLEAGGLMLPHQWTESRNGLPYRDRTLVSVQLDADTAAADFEVTAELRSAFNARADLSPDSAALGATFRGDVEQPEELAPGITQIRGMWNVAVIEHDAALTVIEAPISSAYSERVLEWAAQRYPDKPVTTVISTSDAWPHVGGIREYAAHGIEIRAFELTIPFLDRLIGAPRTRRPDRQQQVGARPKFSPVTAPTEIGSGTNRMVMLPIHGEGGERMLAVYFPEHRLLYASDLIQPGQSAGFFMPAYLAEVEALVAREALAVDTVFAMHLAPTAWSQVTEALAQVRAGTGTASH